jgi:16S rRNA C967 or C1407 C5-methylase (RsmB/RsmF family)
MASGSLIPVSTCTHTPEEHRQVIRDLVSRNMSPMEQFEIEVDALTITEFRKELDRED